MARVTDKLLIQELLILVLREIRTLLEDRGIQFIELHSIRGEDDLRSRSMRFHIQMVYPAFGSRQVAEIREISVMVSYDRIEDIISRGPNEFTSFMSHMFVNYIESDYRKVVKKQFVGLPPKPTPEFPKPKGVRVVRIRKLPL